MFPSYDELPTATSLLMQCGYRSKVCTKARATKIDGSLHKLCEFHRRKANANQQRLHKRQREQRPVDMELLELLLQDARPQPTATCPPNSPVSVDDVSYIIV
ncbi:hypothetical protein PHYSODRAFT_511799 [Phytophthora sojae]|uniref:Uncharacterized protein n=1 Tax=Phytophthora sojae (strain P6497) TaxID=1094619 RepID=G4ZSI3_PHYSP|nr:hypothetical protein PHYSODRAFT_511799 [Phytophthora sojae]EGZ14063.1 hypothetical protein PHYSODRAFT_511799 [Phytophthora sojae]|eukprot:XP_009531492.1 hypothetical protein PHYSODRAFT_511799 [Phytophthora sojae]